MNVRRLLGVVVVASAVGCSSKSSTTTPTDAGIEAPAASPNDFTFDGWALQLFAGLPKELEHDALKRSAQIDAINASSADVLCLVNAIRQADRDAIIAGAKAKFPYSASFPTTGATPVSDPTDASGKTIAPPTTAPCGSKEASDATDVLVACLTKNCSTIPGSGDGMVSSFECYQANCTSEGLAVLGASGRCFNCGVAQLDYTTVDPTLKNAGSRCKTDPTADWIEAGKNRMMLLSKHPLKDAEFHVLPSTFEKDGVIRATVQLPNGATTDVYCGNFNQLRQGITAPYSGQWSSSTDDLGWIDEQRLQAQKTVKFVNAKSTGKAVVILDTESEPEQKDASGKIVLVKTSDTKAYETMLAAFPLALPAGTEFTCTWCSEHGGWFDDANSNYQVGRVFLKGIPVTKVKLAKRVYDQKTWTNWDGKNVTPSQSYGWRTVVQIDP